MIIEQKDPRMDTIKNRCRIASTRTTCCDYGWNTTCIIPLFTRNRADGLVGLKTKRWNCESKIVMQIYVACKYRGISRLWNWGTLFLCQTTCTELPLSKNHQSNILRLYKKSHGNE